jgi:hypothetical protein
MLYGKYVMNGTIDLDKTVKDVGLDDVQKFLPIEQRARLQDLLMSRSGIYHPTDGDDDPGGDVPCPRFAVSRHFLLLLQLGLQRCRNCF